MGIALHTLAPDPGCGAPRVLFCHAAGFAGSVWNQVSREVRAKVGQFALDFRGHGESSPLPGEATWQAFRDDIAQAAARLGPGRLIGVGHSLGGTALLMAESAEPGTFIALLCFEPILPSRDDPSFANGASRRRAWFSSREEAVQHFATKPPLSLLAPAVLSDYVRAGLTDAPEGGVRLVCPPETEAQIYRTAAQSRWQQALPAVACSVILISGQNTTVVPGSYLAKVATRMPSAVAEELPGISHLGPLEDPVGFARQVDRIIATCHTTAAPGQEPRNLRRTAMA